MDNEDNDMRLKNYMSSSIEWQREAMRLGVELAQAIEDRDSLADAIDGLIKMNAELKETQAKLVEVLRIISNDEHYAGNCVVYAVEALKQLDQKDGE